MLTTLQNFDPIAFLEVDTSKLSEQEVTELRTFLMGKIGEYILLKVSDKLTDEQIEEVSKNANNGNILNILRQYIPDIDQRMLQEVEQFKVEYSQNIK